MLNRLFSSKTGILFVVLAISSPIMAHEGGAEGHAANSNFKSIKVTTRTERNVTKFFVENFELSDVTVTFEMGLRNLQGNVDFPYTHTVAGKSKIEVFHVAPVDAVSTWEYSFTNFYKLGSSVAVHDDSFVYGLPYEPGKAFKVTQAYDGEFSHKGSNKYAIDWKMPVGTPVYAARGGVVVKVKDDSDIGGSNIKFDAHNNYVLIRHSDGTLGHYCHLQKDGARVSPGQEVQTGQLIAHSGNTGFSSGPHLHFSVFMTMNGKQRVSIPVKFGTADSANGVTLRAGRSYRAKMQEITSLPTTVSPLGH